MVTVRSLIADPKRTVKSKRWLRRTVWCGAALPRRHGRSMLMAARSLGSTSVLVHVVAFLMLTGCATKPPRNVILISVDDLRPDHLGCYGYTANTSPAIDDLARRGTMFTNAFTAAPWTLPSHMSIFTSLYPSEHGVSPDMTVRSPNQTIPVLPAEIVTLPELLHRNGYATAAFTDGVYVRGSFGFNRGFDLYFENDLKASLPALRAKLFKWLRHNRERKFFVFLHTFEVHAPFKPPKRFLAPPVEPEHAQKQLANFGIFEMALVKQGKLPVTPDLLQQVKRLYDGGIRHVDSFIASLVRELSELGLVDNTLIVFTSDHGEGFYEHESFSHGSNLYEEVLRIPLIFAGPGIRRQRKVEAPVATIDLMPTILDLLDVPLDERVSGVSLKTHLHGWRLWNPWRNDPVSDRRELYAETNDGGGVIAVRSGRYKAIRTLNDGSLQLFDTREDPGEKLDLADAKPELRSEFARLLDEHVERREDKTLRQLPIDPDLERKLRALGYVETQ